MLMEVLLIQVHLLIMFLIEACQESILDDVIFDASVDITNVTIAAGGNFLLVYLETLHQVLEELKDNLEYTELLTQQ